MTNQDPQPKEPQPDANGWYKCADVLPPYDIETEIWLPQRRELLLSTRLVGNGFESDSWAVREMGWLYIDDKDVSHWRYFKPPID